MLNRDEAKKTVGIIGGRGLCGPKPFSTTSSSEAVRSMVAPARRERCCPTMVYRPGRSKGNGSITRKRRARYPTMDVGLAGRRPPFSRGDQASFHDFL